VRVKYSLTPEIYAQIGVYEQNPSYLETGNSFKLSGIGAKGTFVPAEIVRTPNIGKLPGEYRLGAYYSSPSADDLKEDINGQPQAITGAEFKSTATSMVVGLWLSSN